MKPLIWLNYSVGPRRVYTVLAIIKDILICLHCLLSLGLGIFVMRHGYPWVLRWMLAPEIIILSLFCTWLHRPWRSRPALCFGRSRDRAIKRNVDDYEQA